MSARLVLAPAAIALLLGAGCATPMMPAGGPPDRTPPELVLAEPAAGAVHVRSDRLHVEFSKPVDRASLIRAIAITPDFDRPPEVIVRGRRAEIRFPEALRENTTYVITIGTELRDLRNNRLAGPLTLAFSTGAQLDQGQIHGWVRDPDSGRGRAAVGIFAYSLLSPEASLPDPRTERPHFRTETDARGQFRLEHLRDTPFFVVAVDDRNRNRRADPGEAFGAPPQRAVVPVAPGDGEPPIVALYLTRVDTLGPEPLRVRPRSHQRVAVRFTEPVVLAQTDAAAFALTDLEAQHPVTILAVYPDEDPNQIVLQTAPMRRAEHRLDLARPVAVRDTADNPASPGQLTFLPAQEPDDEPARMLGFEPPGLDTLRTLRPGEHAVVRFSRPPAAPAADERIRIHGIHGEPLAATIASTDGVRFTVRPDSPHTFQVRVHQPDSVYVMWYRPLPQDSLGSVAGTIVGAPQGATVHLEAIAPDGYRVQTVAAEDGSFSFPALPTGTYRVRAFADTSDTGRWDGGLLAPYRPPAPLRVLEDVRVRARWEVELDPIVLDPEAAPPPEGLPVAPALDDPEQAWDAREPFLWEPVD